MITILFDLDGTLLDSTEAILEGFEVAFKENSERVRSEEEVKALVGYPLEIMFQKMGVENSKIESCVKSYKLHYRTISRPKTTLLENAKEAIELANEFATLGVVTTKTGRYSIELLEHMDIMKYFKCLIGRENVENPKPHPEPILKAMNLLNSNADKTFMIGDTSLDILSAKDANITPIAVECGYESDLKKYKVEVKKDSLEAVKYIQSLNI